MASRAPAFLLRHSCGFDAPSLSAAPCAAVRRRRIGPTAPSPPRRRPAFIPALIPDGRRLLVAEPRRPQAPARPARLELGLAVPRLGQLAQGGALGGLGLLGLRRRRLARLGGGVGCEGSDEDQGNEQGEGKAFHAHHSREYCGGSAVARSVVRTLALRLYARFLFVRTSRAHPVGASTAQW